MINPNFTALTNPSASQAINTAGTGGLATIFEVFDDYLDLITGFGYKIRTFNDLDFNVGVKDILNLIDGSRGAFELTLPLASLVSVQAITFKRFDSVGTNNITIKTTGGNTIIDPITRAGVSSLSIATNTSITLYPLAGVWNIQYSSRAGRANLADIEITTATLTKNTLYKQGDLATFPTIGYDDKNRWNTTTSQYTSGLSCILVISGLVQMSTQGTVGTFNNLKNLYLVKNGVETTLDNLNYKASGGGPFGFSFGKIVLAKPEDVFGIKPEINNSFSTQLDTSRISFIPIPLN